jgi:hypothetical protein
VRHARILAWLSRASHAACPAILGQFAKWFNAKEVKMRSYGGDKEEPPYLQRLIYELDREACGFQTRLGTS